MGRSLARLTWPEVAERPGLLVVPLGSCEQHGPHLPLDTDTRIAEAVAVALTSTDERTVLGPTIGISASGEHAGFPGTLSFGTVVVEEMLVELARSADAFEGVVVVNGHGGNLEALAQASERIVGEGRRFGAVSCHVPGGEPHAGYGETSILLHLAPEVVHMDRAVPGVTLPWTELGPQAVREGFAAVTPNGVLGDPTRASAADGAVLFEELVARVREQVRTLVASWPPREPVSP
jgi:mycofactocin system creatininase family protein